MSQLVCDTSVMIALHRVGLLHLLPQLSPGVLVPVAVEQELAVGESKGLDVGKLANFDWLLIRKPRARPALPAASLLGPGESEVLWLALETPGSVAVLDDGLARRVAAELAIAFTGTLGVLLDAKRGGLIPALAPILAELECQEFHTSPQLREAILQAAGEATRAGG